MSQIIRVVYPSGDRSKLAFGIMFDYEADEWCIAGRESFPYTEEGQKAALEYGRRLSYENRLVLDYSNLDIDIEPEYLD